MSSLWAHLSDYQCFGCAPHNPAGLALDMKVSDGTLTAPVSFADHHQSYPGIVHGGVVTTALDEVMGNLIILGFGVATFTMTLRTRFLEPLRTGTRYELRAELTESSDRVYKAEAELADEAGVPRALAAATYAPISPEQAREYLGLHEAEITGLAHYLQDQTTTKDRTP